MACAASGARVPMTTALALTSGSRRLP
jgi:hypothetical protein